MAKPIYLDNQATTPTDPRVRDAMLPFLEASAVGNPHSEHFAGRRSASALEHARRQVAALIGAQPEEIVFTSGATEANNIAIQGIARSERGRNHIVTCATEHKCVLESAEYLRQGGFEVDMLPVDRDGCLDLSLLSKTVNDRTSLVSVMTANNEIGVVHPLAEIAEICRSHGAAFHTDAAQAVGKIPFDVKSNGVDLASISGHKLYAPIGIGALFVSGEGGFMPEPLFRGGGQERGLRSGTVAAHLAAAMGAAAEIAMKELEAEGARAALLRTRFMQAIRERIPAARANAESAPRLPGNLSLTLPGIDADRLVGSLQPHLAISTNAACSSGVLLPSHVLSAIGLTIEEAQSTVRLGFGRFNTAEEIDSAALLIAEMVEQIRENSERREAVA